ncbi:hypothetical protein SAMN05428988_3460 [Chitinophaga sp. YR573]|nr:hypothetical protein SAMN05428988_3460 [Chitinophaga sp. YR573]
MIKSLMVKLLGNNVFNRKDRLTIYLYECKSPDFLLLLVHTP